MKKVILSVFAIASFSFAKAQIYMGKDGASSVRIFSKMTLENIDGVNKAAKPVFNTSTGDFQIRINNTGIKFTNGLLEEHFNETYMESNKYPFSTFKGKVQEKVDYAKDGVNNVNVKGTMEIHGVIKEITVPGTITVKGKEVTVHATFIVKCADYKIEIPKNKIGSINENIEITVDSVMEPYVKK